MDELIQRANAWLKANRDRKFFLFLHGYDAHGQNTPGGGFDYRFVDRNYDRKYTGSEQEQEALREEGLERGRLTLRPEDVRTLQERGVSAFLVGEAFMRAEDPGAELARLFSMDAK